VGFILEHVLGFIGPGGFALSLIAAWCAAVAIIPHIQSALIRRVLHNLERERNRTD
jgi:hypothetical protein